MAGSDSPLLPVALVGGYLYRTATTGPFGHAGPFFVPALRNPPARLIAGRVGCNIPRDEAV